MLSRTCFREESVKSVIAASNCLVTRHLTVRLNAMFETEELPASISNLHTSLAEMKTESLTHCFLRKGTAKVLE
jgi:hypothetical protein